MSKLAKKISLAVVALVALFAATAALAVGPMWMPGFPMRMGTNIMLMWAPIPGATGYNVYKSDKEGDIGKLLINLPMNNHMDMNVPMETSAFYTVKAVIGGAEGDASMVGKIIGAKPLDPPKWQGFMPAEGGVNVRFELAAGASFYNVYKSDTKDGTYNLVGSIQETKYLDAAFKEGMTAYYKVSAVDKNNLESKQSEPLEVKVEKKVELKAARGPYTLNNKAIKVTGFFSGSEEKNRSFVSPVFIQADADNKIFYVADSRGVTSWDMNKQLLMDFKLPDNYEGQPGSITQFNVSPDGKTLAAGYTNPNVVRIWNIANGEFAGEFEPVRPTLEEYESYGRAADWEADKDLPTAITSVCFDPDGNIWVSEMGFKQMHIYNSNGDFIKKLGEPKVRDSQDKDLTAIGNMRLHEKLGQIFALSPIDKMVRVFDVKTQDFIKDKEGKPFYGHKVGGTSPGFFQEARGIAVMEDGNLIMVDGIDGRVQILTPNDRLDYVSNLLTDVTKTKQLFSNEFPNIQGVAAIGKTLIFTDTLKNRIAFAEMQ